MIYLLSGDDTKKKLESSEKLLKPIKAKMEVFFINKNNFNREQVENFSSGSSLFAEKCGVVFTNISEREDHFDFILKKIKAMAASQNIFIFSEGKLSKEAESEFKKAGAEIKIFDLPKGKKEKFNSFLLANAFGDRNKLSLWIAFRQAIEAGVKLEELSGVLFWKAKDMILKKNFNKFSEKELEQFVSKISYLLPEARKRGMDDEAAFEQFLLEAF